MSAPALKVPSWDETLAEAGARRDLLAPEDHAVFDRDGYIILRSALPFEWLDPLRGVFERSIPEKWAFPREQGTRFSKIVDDPLVRRACLLPVVLSAVAGMMKRRFYFCDIQGRDPELGGGAQNLHRDWLVMGAPTSIISGFAFLDDFDAENGATRIQPGTHRDALAHGDIVVSGHAGDILLLDAHVLHCGTRNLSGRKRRSLHMSFRGHELFGQEYNKWNLIATTSLQRRLMGSEE